MNTFPSVDSWIKEAKALKDSGKIGMYLIHNGVVRQTPKAVVREGSEVKGEVKGMLFSYDAGRVEEIRLETEKMEGIYLARVWLNEGTLKTGDDIMLVLIGGDIRPRVIDALNYMVGRIKNECVTETELF